MKQKRPGVADGVTFLMKIKWRIWRHCVKLSNLIEQKHDGVVFCKGVCKECSDAQYKMIRANPSETERG